MVGYTNGSAERWVVATPLGASIVHSSSGHSHGEALVIGVTEAVDLDSRTRPRARHMVRVAAQHRNSRAEFGTTKRDHVFPARG